MKNLVLLTLVVLITIPTHGQRRAVSNNHRWSVFTGLLAQGGPFQEFLVRDNNAIYARKIDYWQGGRAGLGTFIGTSYDYTMSNRLTFRLQGQIETTGWIAGIIDLGFGARLPIARQTFVVMEGYFSVLQTGASLGLVNPLVVPDNKVETLDLYMGFFGFKGRFGVEFPLPKKMFLTPYISYVAYPWHAGNFDGVFINGSQQGALVDSLQIGLDFGAKF